MATYSSITEAERQRRLRSGRWTHARPESVETKSKPDETLEPIDWNITPFPEINWLLQAFDGFSDPRCF